MVVRICVMLRLYLFTLMRVPLSDVAQLGSKEEALCWEDIDSEDVVSFKNHVNTEVAVKRAVEHLWSDQADRDDAKSNDQDDDSKQTYATGLAQKAIIQKQPNSQLEGHELNQVST
ncbi:hypothetical protein PR048_002212 [Dryococelus australis]|uniref:Uncharacterized protein n=1 Tax=Dryococelus australis TaxID=614101 RepID=A0ABQ9IJK1_9NEOP|nr:hypothetical protein PR048_002212 [Dryococelus australis]